MMLLNNLYFILFYFILFYFTLFYFILFYFILFYFILFYFILFYFILFYFIYFILFYFILFYFILFYFILFYFILFYFILFYFILFYFILFILMFIPYHIYAKIGFQPLQRHGLKAHIRQTSSFTPTRDGSKYMLMGRDSEQTLREIAKFSPKDAQAYPEYEAKLEQYGTGQTISQEIQKKTEME